MKKVIVVCILAIAVLACLIFASPLAGHELPVKFAYGYVYTVHGGK